MTDESRLANPGERLSGFYDRLNDLTARRGELMASVKFRTRLRFNEQRRAAWTRLERRLRVDRAWTWRLLEEFIPRYDDSFCVFNPVLEAEVTRREAYTTDTEAWVRDALAEFAPRNAATVADRDRLRAIFERLQAACRHRDKLIDRTEFLEWLERDARFKSADAGFLWEARWLRRYMTPVLRKLDYGSPTDGETTDRITRWDGEVAKLEQCAAGLVRTVETSSVAGEVLAAGARALEPLDY